MTLFTFENLERRRIPGAFVAALAVMVFAPWIYFLFPSATPHFLAIGFLAGLVTAFLLVPKDREGLLIAFAIAAFMLIPSNIFGHMVAHLTSAGCYD